MNTKITKDLVQKIASLAKLPIEEKNITKLQHELESSFEYINKIQTIDTSHIEETSQVSGLENVFREDIIEKERTLSQKDALSQAKSTYKGYFKVKAIFNEE